MINVLIDTTHLFDSGEGFGNPDFQKILQYSKDGYVKIFVPHIAWEERRTQILESALNSNRNLRKAFEAMSHSKNILLEDFPKSPSYEIDDKNLISESKKRMNDFASLHNITVLPLAGEHAERAWKRFFEASPPFDSTEKDRKNRRKDIPDSWILESAIDLKISQPDMVVLARDGKLSSACEFERIKVVKEFSSLFELIEECIKPQPAPVEVNPSGNELENVIEKSQLIFKGLDKKVLGYIAYFDGATKEEILKMLSQKGISSSIFENIATRLVISNLITDSGNHYLVKNKSAAELARGEFEDEIISLLQGAE